MNKRAAIIQFRQETASQENELEDILRKIDDPEEDFPELLFANLDSMDSVHFSDNDEDDHYYGSEK